MSPASIPSAADLKKRFAAQGIRPNRRLGQNFLVDSNMMRFVARSAALSSQDVVLEPGAGTGALTALLAEKAGAVVAVEIDRKLYGLAAEHLDRFANVFLFQANVMGPDDSITPRALLAIRTALDTVPRARFKVVANLPYVISTSCIVALLTCAPTPDDIYVMVQREVADRICAVTGTAQYGYLSVIVQAVAHTKVLRRVSPKAFWPQPEVDSAILYIRPDPALRHDVGDLAALRRLAGALFTHRRKQMAAILVRTGIANDRPTAETLLSRVGLEPTIRPEQVRVEQFIELAARLS